MNKLTQMIKESMKPALGVTEPGAIAYASARAYSEVGGKVSKIILTLNSGIYKNAFTCGIPGTDEIGNKYAAMLGVIAGDHTKGLGALEGINEQDVQEARKIIDYVEVRVESISSDIYIKSEVITDIGNASVEIRGSHTNISRVSKNGIVVYENEYIKEAKDEQYNIKDYSLKSFVEYINSVDYQEIKFVENAIEMNLTLAEVGYEFEKNTITHMMMKKLNVDKSNVEELDLLNYAEVITSSAFEARLMGAEAPAMSITGSGGHGIVSSLPVYAAAKKKEVSKEMTARAVALSFLVTMLIKEHAGKLSAYCGCAIAGGTGSAVAMTYLQGGSIKQMEYTINNVASDILGMICDGGNQGCVLKGLSGLTSALRASELAINDVHINMKNGINAKTPEETMRNMGLIASPGMDQTEKVILNILEEKVSYI